MKKKILALVSVMVVGCCMILAGCGGSGSGGGGPLAGSPLVGDWKVASAEAFGISMTLEDLEWTPDSVTVQIKESGDIKMTAETDDNDYEGTLEDQGDGKYALAVDIGGEEPVNFIFYVNDDGQLVSDWSEFMDTMILYFEK